MSINMLTRNAKLPFDAKPLGAQDVPTMKDLFAQSSSIDPIVPIEQFLAHASFPSGEMK